MSVTRASERHDTGQATAGVALPDANDHERPAVSDAAAAAGPRKGYSRRSLGIAFIAGLIVATIAFALVAAPRDASPHQDKHFYDRIQLGMTRPEVWRLMQSSYSMYSTIESTDIMIVDERFMIAVTYAPKPPEVAPAGNRVGQPPDSWVVWQKAYVDHKRAGFLENAMSALQLIPERLRCDRVREQ
jgi:hypothetical protein